ncbi:MAG: 16S rRNA (cytidine(1402)-2'-O)-methyltransferase [Pseudomonadota bacterium]
MTRETIELKPGLYVTATPIGNLGDITFRAVETLKNADLILCEDTRQTAKLCAAYGIATPRQAYHDHNAARVRPAILQKLEAGKKICLVSDAGTPLIADPGFKLVREAIEADVEVFAIPGPSAAIAALSIAGAPTDRFTFAGFPPQKGPARRTFFKTLHEGAGALVFYEAASRLSETLADMAAIFGADRRAAVARELTKLHEEIARGRLDELAARFSKAPPKGEIVVILWPAEAAAVSEEALDAFLHDALSAMSVKDAAQAAAEALGVSKRVAYERALAIKNAK